MFLTTAIVVTGVVPVTAAAQDDKVPEPTAGARDLMLSTAGMGLFAQELPAQLHQSARVVATDVDGTLRLETVRLDTTLVRRQGADVLTMGDLAWQPAAAPLVRVGGMQWQGALDAPMQGPVQYRVASGFLRRGYAAESNAYDGAPVTLASLRAGFTDWLTLEAASENVEQLHAGRVAAEARVGRLGAFSGSAARSSTANAGGARWTQAWQLSRGGVDLRASRSTTSGTYRSLAQIQEGSTLPRRATDVRIGGELAGGAAQIGYAMAQAPQGAPTRVGTVAYARELPHRWRVAGTATQDLAGSALTAAVTVSHTFR